MKRAAIRCSSVLIIILGFVIFLRSSTPTVSTNNWVQAGPMTSARSGACSVLLDDSRIVVTGGTEPNATLNTAEVFQSDGTFAPVAPMTSPRSNHTCSRLADGTVLATGGQNDSGPLSSAEIYDPSTNTWSPLPGMMEARSGHTATILQDGRIAVAGGNGANGPLQSIEVFSPSSKTFSTVPAALASPRKNHAAALLPDGRVLIAGGSNGVNALSSSDIFDPIAGSISAGPDLSALRSGLSATALLDGKILLAGGNDGSADLASADLYDPSAGTLAPSGNLGMPRSGHQAFLLPNNNQVLLVGGNSGEAATSTTELYVPWAGSFRPTGSLASPRAAATGSTMKTDGLLFVAGGNASATSELYGFATVKTDKDDYAPGTMVTITGSGWKPGEGVTLTLVESPYYDTHETMTAVADGAGNFVNTQFSPDEHDIGIRFYLTATGSTSQAQTTFTDATSFKAPNIGAQSPNPVTPGGSVTYPVSVDFKGNGTCTVNLSITTPLPTGAAASFSPTSLTGSSTQTLLSTLTITTTSSTPVGTTQFTVQARGTGGSGNDCTTSAVQTTTANLVIGNSPTSLSVTNASGVYGGTTALSATLSSGGSPIAGKTVSFTLNGNSAGNATTNASGVATLSNVSLSGINAGTYSSGVGASFAGDASFTSSTGTAILTISQADAIVAVQGYSGVYDGNPHKASGSATGVKGEDLSILLDLGQTFTDVPGGTATWKFAGNTNYKSATGSAAITISQADASIKVDGYSGVYDGNPHGASGFGYRRQGRGSQQLAPPRRQLYQRPRWNGHLDLRRQHQLQVHHRFSRDHHQPGRCLDQGRRLQRCL